MKITFARRAPLSAALGDEHRGAVDQRRAAAARLVAKKSAAEARVAAAPPGYLLVHGSSDIARHCELLSPLPRPGEVRVDVTPGRKRGEWHVDVATCDRPGLLAAFTGVLAEVGADVVQAVLATWEDGAALEAFVLRAAEVPDAVDLQARFVESLSRPTAAEAVTDAVVVTFDGDASALYTRCDVRATDRPGLLHSLAVAIASAGADVHAARVTTIGDVAHDVFDLSDRAGNKLDGRLIGAIADRLREGVGALRR